MNKRFFALLLALTLLLSLLPTSALAADNPATEDGLLYEILRDDAGAYAVITGFTTPPAHLTIPASIDGIPVRSIADEAFKNCKTLTHLMISEGITGIGELAFQSCTGLTEVTLPSTLRDMDWLIFFDCTALKTAVIPEGIPEIEYGMFNGCEKLTDVTIPDSVKLIDTYAFTGCKSLTEVVIPEGVTAIGNQTFCDCTGLKTVTLPESLTHIGYQAFLDCKRLETVRIPAAVTEIGLWAFGDCKRLTKVQFCGNAPKLDNSVFANVTADVYYPKDDPTWTEELRRSLYGKLTWIPYAPLPFSDVPLGEYYYDSVAWALEAGITTGLTETTFSPAASCNRAQAVTFLWRAAGCPAPASTENPFVDVKKGEFYEQAVLWAVENGITNGTDATHFSPGMACNRATIVTFLHRAFENPAVENTENPFSDVPADTWYTAPVLWAVEQGITNGMGGDIFGVDSTCNRAQMVTFLHRAYN